MRSGVGVVLEKTVNLKSLFSMSVLLGMCAMAGTAAAATQQAATTARAAASKPNSGASHSGTAGSPPACSTVLQSSSADYIAQYTTAHSANEDDTLKAIDTYGKCYEARTNQLNAALNKSGKGPLMGANGNFRDFQAALKDFTTKALADTEPPGDALRRAYASLYVLQFRYEFLQRYAHPDPNAGTLTAEQSDEMSKAKNRFGELLGILKADQFHEVHSAFSDVLALVNNDVTKLEVYRYGIFLLARPGEKAFAPPPF
jgi:hypothetical protein